MGHESVKVVSLSEASNELGPTYIFLLTYVQIIMYDTQHKDNVRNLLSRYMESEEEIKLEFREEILKLDKDRLLLAKYNITVEGLCTLINENAMLDHQILMYMYIEEFKNNSIVIPLEYTLSDTLGLTICLQNTKDFDSLKNFIIFPVYLSYQHYAVFIYSKDKNIVEYYDSLISKNYENKYAIISNALVKSGISSVKPLLHIHKDTEIQKQNSNECGYFSWYFTKCRVGKKQIDKINVEKIKEKFVSKITNDIFELTEKGDLNKLPEFWQFDSSEMSLCLENFISFENLDKEFPELEDIESSLFDLSEIMENKIFSCKIEIENKLDQVDEKIAKQKERKNKRKKISKNGNRNKKVKRTLGNSTEQNMEIVQNKTNSTVQNKTNSTEQNMENVQNKTNSTVQNKTNSTEQNMETCTEQNMENVQNKTNSTVQNKTNSTEQNMETCTDIQNKTNCTDIQNKTNSTEQKMVNVQNKTNSTEQNMEAVQNDNKINKIIQKMTTNTDYVDKETLLSDETKKLNRLSILMHEKEFKSKPSNYTGGYLENVTISNKIVSELPDNIKEIRFLHEKTSYIEKKMSTVLNKNELNNEINEYFLKKKRSDWSCENNLDNILKSISSVRKHAWTIFAKYLDEKPSLALGLIARATIYHPTSPHFFSYSNKNSEKIFKKLIENLFPGIKVLDQKST